MRKFLASVGNAKLLYKENKELKHLADVRTLTESTLSFSNSMEEVRAGEGAQLYGRFSHSSGINVTLTDALWDLKYIAKQVGGASLADPTAMFQDPDVAYDKTNHKITLSRDPQNIGESCGLDTPVVWVRPKGCKVDTEWAAVIVTDSNYTNKQLTLPSTLENLDAIDNADGVCVEYFVKKPEARSVKINANFIPAELVLLLTTKLFAGDANAPETGKPVGTVTVKIPRFQLDAQFDLNMAMTSAATINLNGTALAVDDGTCDGKGVYAEIVEVETDSTVMTGLVDVLIDEDTIKKETKPGVYGKYSDGHISVIDKAFYAATTGLIDSSTDEFVANKSGYIVVYDSVNYNLNAGAVDAVSEAGAVELSAKKKGETQNTTITGFADHVTIPA